MVNPDFVSDVQRRVTRTKCPSCGEPHLEFSVSCDLSREDCIFLASCSRCHVRFDLDAESFPAGLSTDSLQFGNILCPTCDQPLAVVTLTCKLSSHSCEYGLRCPDCGD
ncbi:MAG: hypothetical protein ABI665_06995 [Vicinamibacterales bacterium]